MTIRWPAEFTPAASPVHVVNRIDAPVPPSLAWARLVRATDWPSFYDNASNVNIEGGGADLFADARFSWKTFGVSLESRVVEFEPESRIAWLATGAGVRAYHAWLITPTDTGCAILTEETQRGVVARIGRRLFPKRMEYWHQKWLEALAAAPRRRDHRVGTGSAPE